MYFCIYLVMTIGTRGTHKLYAGCLVLTQHTLLPLSDLLLDQFLTILLWMMWSVKEMKPIFCFVSIQNVKIVPLLKELVLYAKLQVHRISQMTFSLTINCVFSPCFSQFG